MVEQIDPADVDELELDGVEPTLQAIGYELGASAMRPNLWRYEPGESNERHRHDQQEELYYLIDGEVSLDVDGTPYTLSPGQFLLVEPSAWRRVSAHERSTLFVVGVPNVADDAIFDE
ncbi:cupin domain-containing protein [Natronobiforma cellulositropha]|uniref:cupin domain-containing protein n=1 Tax=Natronobiforma cellulositropha TaxID=1679076 RepID=UPI0021D60F7B|nr:cupin domain-containing protein [Natronobiforma cellulositropha]